MADEKEKDPEMAGGLISGILQGIGGVVAGVGAINQSNVDDTCGKKPGIFAPRAEKDEYNECLKRAAAAKIEMMKAQAAQAKVANDTSNQNRAIIVASIVFGVVIILTVIVVIVSRRRNSEAA